MAMVLLMDVLGIAGYNICASHIALIMIMKIGGYGLTTIVLLGLIDIALILNYNGV